MTCARWRLGHSFADLFAYCDRRALAQTVCVTACLFVLSAILSAAPQTQPVPDISDAENPLRVGSYDQAVTVFEQLAKDQELQIRATVGIAEAFRLTGKYTDALDRLGTVEGQGESDDTWHVARAEVLVEIGRYDEAIKSARRAVELNGRNTTARRLLGQLYEIVGQRDQAVETYAWFDALLKQRYPTQASALTDAGIAIHRHAALSPGKDASLRMRYVLHELFQPAYGRFDKKYWPACLASADLLLSKYNLEQAIEEYQAALEINPNLARAHVGLGAAALCEWKFEEVEKHLSAALKANPNEAAAHVLQARLRMTERKYSQAATAAGKALDTNPNDLAALGVLAAARLRSGDEAGMHAAASRAREVNASSPVVDHELGIWLESARQFDEAEAHFKRAIELAPEWADPKTALGLLYMETGDERAARRVLDDSWELDRFNEKTFHTLNLLDELEKFGRYETEHFVIKTGEGRQAAIRPYLAAYLEGIYAEVCQQYGGPVPDKTVVEVFDEHRWFAIRITGRPFIHTIGACTGPVIAMDAPAASAESPAFNWARVLRHEFAHTVTLHGTCNRIPHWLTEGLAVRAERNVRPWDWCVSLSMAMRRARLFDLDSIDWAFVRPQRPGDRTLAYAQSEWMVEYLVERSGPDVIGKMLDTFRDDKRQPAVFEQVVGQSPADFMNGFTDWARQQVKTWNLSTTPIPSVDEAKAQLAEKKGAGRVALLIDLASALLDDGETDEAAERIREALELDESNTHAMVVMARVLLARAAKADDEVRADALRDEAVQWAKRLLEHDADSPHAAWVLARAAIEADDHDEAIRHLERLREYWPGDPFSYEHLGKIYADRNEPARALPMLVEFARMAFDDVALRLQIAEIHEADGRIDEAISWHRDAIQIAPYSVNIHEKLGELLTRATRFDEAAQTYEVLTRLDPSNGDHHSRLALALHRAGRNDQARAAARRAVAIDPNCEAKTLLSGE